jgi:putative membrane protein
MNGYGTMGGYGVMNGGYGVMGFGMLVPLLIILFLGYIIYQNSNKVKKSESNAINILEKRLANGEIDIKEYKEKRAILENS